MADYAYDPDFLPYLPELPTVGDYSTAEKIQAVRAERDAVFEAIPARDTIAMEDRAIAGPAGAPDVPVRIYRPKAAAAAPRAGFLEIHGGGFLFGTIDMMDGWCQWIAETVDCVVVSVGYRLAPEAPYPGGLHDCYAALVWLHDHAAELGVDPTRIAIGGQSAGGGLAAGLALYARDQGGPPICYQLLEIPEIDDRLDTPSMHAFQDTPFLEPPECRPQLAPLPRSGPHGRARDLRGARPCDGGAARRSPAGLRLDDGVRPAARRGHPLCGGDARGGHLRRAPQLRGHLPRLRVPAGGGAHATQQRRDRRDPLAATARRPTECGARRARDEDRRGLGSDRRPDDEDARLRADRRLRPRRAAHDRRVHRAPGSLPLRQRRPGWLRDRLDRQHDGDRVDGEVRLRAGRDVPRHQGRLLPRREHRPGRRRGMGRTRRWPHRLRRGTAAHRRRRDDREGHVDDRHDWRAAEPSPLARDPAIARIASTRARRRAEPGPTERSPPTWPKIR